MTTRPAPAVLLLLLLAACSAPAPGLIPDRPLRIAVAPFSQPLRTPELLAGQLPRGAEKLPPGLLQDLDAALGQTLAGAGRREFLSREATSACLDSAEKPATTAFSHWIDVGRCLGADLILVPQMLFWREEDEHSPASVITDIFLLRPAENALVARSRHDDRERLPPGLFPGGKGRSAAWTLALEAMLKAVKEFGL